MVNYRRPNKLSTIVIATGKTRLSALRRLRDRTQSMTRRLNSSNQPRLFLRSLCLRASVVNYRRPNKLSTIVIATGKTRLSALRRLRDRTQSMTRRLNSSNQPRLFLGSLCLRASVVNNQLPAKLSTIVIATGKTRLSALHHLRDRTQSMTRRLNSSNQPRLFLRSLCLRASVVNNQLPAKL
jgi:hypothetical protein